MARIKDYRILPRFSIGVALYVSKIIGVIIILHLKNTSQYQKCKGHIIVPIHTGKWIVGNMVAGVIRAVKMGALSCPWCTV